VKRIIIVLLLFWVNVGQAQEKEHIALFTDRDIYTSGETILFNVIVPSGEGSAMININLINTRGKIVCSVNKKISNDQANGFIYLPDSMKTGTYLLCSSTRDNPALTVKELFICNRFAGLIETTTVLRAKDITPFVEKPVIEPKIEGISKSYKAREKVKTTLRLPANFLTNIKDHLFVAVVESTPGYNSQTFYMTNVRKNQDIFEKEGIVVEGFVKDSSTDTPFNKGCIFLSVPDSIPWLDYLITGEDGYFHFQLKDYYGEVPVVVQGFDPAKKKLLKISLNQTDSIKEGVPAYESQAIPMDIQKSIGNSIEATTMRKIFNCQEISIINPQLKKRHEYPFYGVPTETVHPALFIDLPDFNEISRELLSGVKFRAFNRIPTLNILNPTTLNYFNDAPLVLLNGIPVQDLNVIKNMGSKDIDRIEICRRERFYGDLDFQGVVAIYSSKQANMFLPESDELIKLNLDAIQPDCSLNIPREHIQNEPDLRKVLLWQPEVKPAESIKLDFETSDIKGHYKITVRGINLDGEVIYTEQTFEVN
jgi:hypothetical protein